MHAAVRTCIHAVTWLADHDGTLGHSVVCFAELTPGRPAQVV